jgi:sodium/hydrogen antiporter
VAMLGSGAAPRTVGFLGWFGPRGLASIVFAVIVVQEAKLPGTNTILVATYVTVGASVMAHGVTAAPLARWYADWYGAHPPHRRPAMESVPAAAHRTRGYRGPAWRPTRGPVSPDSDDPSREAGADHQRA